MRWGAALRRLPTTIPTALITLTLVGQAAAGATVNPQTQYEQALAKLAQVPSFRFIERVDVRTGARHTARTELRFQAPDRLQTMVTNIAPPPQLQLMQVQVGTTQCQTPPGVCYHTKRHVNAVTAVRTLLGSTRAVHFSTTNAPAGRIAITLSKPGPKHSRYIAELTIDAHTGLPATFTARIVLGAQRFVSQNAYFNYRHREHIALPNLPKPS